MQRLFPLKLRRAQVSVVQFIYKSSANPISSNLIPLSFAAWGVAKQQVEMSTGSYNHKPAHGRFSDRWLFVPGALEIFSSVQGNWANLLR